MEKKRRFFLCLVQKKNWHVSAARNKQDCFLLLTLVSFFLKIFFRNTSIFSPKNVEKLKKIENFCYVWFKQKNWQVSAARNKQDSFLLLTLGSFCLNFLFRNTSIFALKNVEKLKKVKIFVIFGSKKKLASVSS